MVIKSPFDDLMEDHVALLLEMGDLLQKLKELANKEEPVLGIDTGILRNSLELFHHRLRAHFRREEEGLYPEAQRLISEQAKGADIFGRFFAEEAEEDMGAHSTLSKRINEMLNITHTMQANDELTEEVSRRLLAQGNAAASLLQRHAEKEDTMIFPLLARSLTPTQVGQVSERLLKIGSSRDLILESPGEDLSKLGG